MNKAHQPPAVWDRFTIKAEVHRRGMTLTGIARAAGLHDSACRKALFGIDYKGAVALSDALRIPFDTLFPTGFQQARSSRENLSRNERSSERQKQGARSDRTGVRT